MNRNIDDPWTAADLSDLIATIESGQRPYGGVTEASGEIPSLGGENIREGGGLDLSAVKKVPIEFFRRMTKGVLRNEDVLINKDGANTGKVGIYHGEFPVATINEHLFLLRGKAGVLEQRFLYRVLCSEQGQRTIRAKISGSAQPGLKSDFTRNFPVFLPASPAEQSRIALVLDTVDELIERTEAVVAKLKQVRAGLLHDLLTRGLDAHGHLRPPPAQAPHLYQDSPLGPIPKEWEVAPLGHVAELVQGGRLGLTKENDYQSTGFPAYSAAGQDGYVAIAEFHQPGVVLSAIGAHCGKCFLAEISWTTLANVQAILPHEKMLLARWLFLQANQPGFWPRSGSAQPFIKPSDVRARLILLPPVSEQTELTKNADAIDEMIESETKTLAKLHHLKSGLMEDLLTGRVRVPATLEVLP